MLIRLDEREVAVLDGMNRMRSLFDFVQLIYILQETKLTYKHSTIVRMIQTKTKQWDLDFQKAFDIILRKRLMTKVNAPGFRYDAARWTNNWLSECHQRIYIN